MTEHKETKNANDPRNQAAAQIGDPEAEPGSPGYYSPPDPGFGVSKSPPNEVRPAKLVEEAERIPDTRSPWDKKQAEGAGTSETDYESHTIPELRDMAEKRGIQIESGARKDEIIDALKKGE